MVSARQKNSPHPLQALQMSRDTDIHQFVAGTWKEEKNNCQETKQLFRLQEVLAACLQSVSQAALTIGSNPAKTKADGQLFEIKHLLILREQIAPFQVDFKVKETSLNFSQIKTAAVSLMTYESQVN